MCRKTETIDGREPLWNRVQSGRAGLLRPREKKKARTVLSGAVGSCMETSLKYVLRKVGGGYPLNRFFLEVEYVLFIWYLESYTHSIIYPLLN